ncbi:MAG: UDP-3-O-(3-hydroxymyristoyl)glucosamine N-acyltransferase [Planctomycetota bacterium]
MRLRDLVEPLARFQLPCTIDGDADRDVIGIATLEDARPNELSFLSNAKYEKALSSTKAGAVIVAQTQAVPPGLTVLRVPDSYAAMCVLMVHLHGYRQHPRAGHDARATIHPTAKIGENANIHHGVTICENVTIGKNAAIYPGCYISAACQIGDNVALFPNVVIYEGCILGHRVSIHANSTIGEDGLGYAPVGEKWHKIPQIGIVEIGDDVEIGANCSIDRATLGRTLIGPGTKFSNQIAIGHGTKIGRDCMFVAQVGIAGSVTVGNHVTLAGKVGVAGHLTIGDNAQLAAMSGVMNDIPADTALAGAPAIPIKDALRSFSLIARLPEMHKRVKELAAEIEALRKAVDGR